MDPRADVHTEQKNSGNKQEMLDPAQPTHRSLAPLHNHLCEQLRGGQYRQGPWKQVGDSEEAALHSALKKYCRRVGSVTVIIDSAYRTSLFGILTVWTRQ